MAINFWDDNANISVFVRKRNVHPVYGIHFVGHGFCADTDFSIIQRDFFFYNVYGAAFALCNIMLLAAGWCPHLLAGGMIYYCIF